ncbi:MurR/RpiR family transcriptional regulator [Carnobacteriaceae bacterium zg-ZUI240]|nr:MurR/RpiR family transcriptional regulator [Carnobacteriaceae bacterium zg-ZUI240]
MVYLEKNMIPIIESVYDNLTPTEKSVADYFKSLKSVESLDLSAEYVSQLLFVSLATLTRFAKKCGFAGYRQFIFDFQQQQFQSTQLEHNLTKSVLLDYEEILKNTYSLINEAQCQRIVSLLNDTKRVYIYGMGSSGVAAQEIKLRFMRLGLVCEAITDDHMIKMNRVLIDESCLVIGVSISGKTNSVISGLSYAKQAGAKTILITSKQNEDVRSICDELVLVASIVSLEKGNIISPQFPILVTIDIVYAFYMDSNRSVHSDNFNNTLNALNLE